MYDQLSHPPEPLCVTENEIYSISNAIIWKWKWNAILFLECWSHSPAVLKRNLRLLNKYFSCYLLHTFNDLIAIVYIFFHLGFMWIIVTCDLIIFSN